MSIFYIHIFLVVYTTIVFRLIPAQKSNLLDKLATSCIVLLIQ